MDDPNDDPNEAHEAILVLGAIATPNRALIAFRDSFREGASRKTMLASLAACARLLTGDANADPAQLPWHLLRYEHVRSLAARLAKRGDKPATQQIRLTAVRRIVEECWNLQLIDTDTLERIRSVKSQKRDVNAPLAGRVLDTAEQAQLYDAAAKGKGAAAPRDTALLVLGLAAGLRREEISTVPLWNGELGVKASRIVVFGKGGKIREVPLTLFTAARLAPWTALRGAKPGTFLLSLHGQSFHAPRVPIDRSLSPSGVWAALQDLGERAKLADFSPHDLRRTFITELLEAGVDPITVARLAGHDDVKTTMRYDRRGDKAKVAAVEALSKHRREGEDKP